MVYRAHEGLCCHVRVSIAISTRDTWTPPNTSDDFPGPEQHYSPLMVQAGLGRQADASALGRAACMVIVGRAAARHACCLSACAMEM